MILTGNADKADTEGPTKYNHQIQKHNNGLIVPPGAFRPKVLETNPVKTGQKQGHGGDVANVIEKTALADGHEHKQVVQDHHQDNAVVDTFQHTTALVGRIKRIPLPECQRHLHGAGGVHSKVHGNRLVGWQQQRHHKMTVVDGPVVERPLVAQQKRFLSVREVDFDVVQDRVTNFHEIDGFHSGDVGHSETEPVHVIAIAEVRTFVATGGPGFIW